MKKLQRLLAMMLTVVLCVGSIGDAGFKVFAADGTDEAVSEDTAVSEDAVVSGDEMVPEDAAAPAEVDEEAEAEEAVPEAEVSDDMTASEDEPVLIPEEDGDEDAEEEADDTANLSIWVGGKQVTTANCDNIPGVTGTGAKASFDIDKNVLKLENVTGFEGSYPIKGHGTKKAYIYSERSITISGDIDYYDTETNSGSYYVLFVQGTNNTLTLDTTKFYVYRPGVTPIGTDGDLVTGNNFKSATVYAPITYGTAVEIGGSATFTKGKFDATGHRCGIKVEGDITVNGGELIGLAKNSIKDAGTAISCRNLTVKSGKFDAWYDADRSVSGWYAAEIKGDLDVDLNNMYVSAPYGAAFKDKTFWDEYAKARGDSITKASRVIIERDSSAKYPVWVGGVRLTENKAKCVPGLTGGVANYDNDTKTFMLKDVSGFAGNKNGYGIYAEQDITVAGTADFATDESGFGFINTTKNLNITKPDYDKYKEWLQLVTLYEFNVKTDIKAKVSSTVLKAGTDITIKDSAIDVTSTGSGITAISAGGNISVESNSLKAKADNGVAIQGKDVDGGFKINPEYLKIVKPEGGSISKGTVLNSNGQKATYVETGVVTPYNVWVGNIRVTSENYSDILGNGKASYDHSTKTLTLNGLKDTDISAAYEVSSTVKAYIYAEQNLTIKGSAELTGISSSIYQNKGTLTVDADLKLSPTSSGLYVQEGALNINGGKIECATGGSAIFTLTGDITINGGDINVSTTSDSALVAAVTSWGGKFIINGGKFKAESANVALMVVGKITMSDTVEIYEPDGGKISDSGTQIVDKEGKAAKSVLIDKVLPKYQVAFNANGHGTAPAMQNVREGFKATDPGAITAAGWTFTGWYEEKACENLYDFDTPVTGQITLYAGWLDNSKTYYKVKFDLNGHGDAADLPNDQTIEKDHQANAPAKKPFEAGYIFKGWATEKTSTTPFDFYTPVKSDLTLYAIWVPDKIFYAVTFDLNGAGGTAPAVQNIEEGQRAEAPEDPVYAGHKFSGWYTDKGGKNAYVFTTPVTSNITLYAGWINIYTVSFDLNGATGTTPASQKIEDGKLAKAPEDPVYAGYKFSGWFIDKEGKNAFVFTTPVTADITLYAGWIKLHSVSFNMNGKSVSAPSIQIIEDGKPAEVPEEPVDGEYNFTGWFTEAACENIYDFATPVTSDLTLYAGWKLKNSALDTVPVISAGDTEITLVKGQKFTLPGAPDVKWETSGKKYAAINKKGVLTAKKVTNAPVEIKDGTRTVKVTIVQPKFADKTINTTVDYEAKPLGFNVGADIPVAYYCNSPDVIVTEQGKYIAVAKGKATVTAYVNGKAYTCKIIVSEKPAVENRRLHMNLDTTRQLKVPGVKITEWSVETDTVVRLSGKKNDKVTAVGVGSALVKGKDKDGKEYCIAVTVEDPRITNASMTSPKPGKYSVIMDKNTTEKIEFAAVDQYVIFKSSKPDVAYADEYGNIRAQKAGSSKLTAKINGKTVTIMVEVR